MSTKLKAGTATSGAVIDADTAGTLEIQTGSTPTTAITVDASQNVGIGTTSPTVYGSYKTLEVKGSGGGLVQFGTGATTAAYLYQDGTNAGFTNISNGGMVFATNNTARMTIDSSGNLLVGTTTYAGSFSGYRIHVKGTNAGIGITATANGDYGIGFNNASNSLVGNITINSTSTAYNTSSDYRLKDNVAPMQNALNIVQQLKPVTYTWKATGEDSQGFIAHELQEVVPDCVTGEKDAVDADGNPVYQGIDTSFLVATLTASIQELKAIVDAQAERIAVLEAK